MERVTDTQPSVDVFENDIEMYLKMFCEEQNIESLNAESQAGWNAALIYINKRAFNDRNLLKANNITDSNSGVSTTNYNAYNYKLIDDICNIYIYLCMMYDKEISIMGFSLLTGIHYDTISAWGREGTKLSNLSSSIAKKLIQFREESLSNKLITGKRNPVGVIAVLNRQFGWASPYTSDSRSQNKPLPANELPTLGNNTNNLSLTDGQTEEKAGINNVIDVLEEPQSLDTQGLQ